MGTSGRRIAEVRVFCRQVGFPGPTPVGGAPDERGNSRIGTRRMPRPPPRAPHRGARGPWPVWLRDGQWRIAPVPLGDSAEGGVVREQAPFDALGIFGRGPHGPAAGTGLSSAGTWTAASPATTCPTLPKTQCWRLWRTWAVPGGALNRSSRRKRVTWGWTNTRPGVGLAGINT